MRFWRRLRLKAPPKASSPRSAISGKWLDVVGSTAATAGRGHFRWRRSGDHGCELHLFTSGLNCHNWRLLQLYDHRLVGRYDRLLDFRWDRLT
jgi:hypothetical protein